LSSRLSIAASLALLLSAAPAWAGCSRTIVVPVAPTGFNVSRRSLSKADQAQLHQLLRQAAQGTLWKWFQHYYPAHIAAFAIRHHEPVTK
jgi:hypothetical protein